MTLQAVDHVDLMFRCFADRTRLRLMHMLHQRNEMCVCDLMRVLDLPQAKASRHLVYLQKAGLIKARSKRQWVYYRLAPAKGKLHAKLLECLDNASKDLPALQIDLKQLNQCKNLSECGD